MWFTVIVLEYIYLGSGIWGTKGKTETIVRDTKSTLKVFGSANRFAKYMAINAKAFSAILLLSTSPSLSASRAAVDIAVGTKLRGVFAITSTSETIPQFATKIIRMRK